MANDSISLSVIQARIKAAEAEYLQAEEAVRKAVEQRDRLRTALQVFEEMLGGADSEAVAPSPLSTRSTSRRAPRSSPKKTRSPSTAERAIQVLEAHGEFMTTNDLLEILQAKGFKPNPKARPYDALYGLLWHGSKKTGSRLVTHDMKWGLREWLKGEDRQDAKEEEVP